jgi:hypothetical protein
MTVAPLALAGCLLAGQGPQLEIEARGCAPPGGRPRVCAQAVGERGIARVRVVFRAAGTAEYWATAMRFDGVRYCAWLPRPVAQTLAVEYYVEAFDVEFEISRTRTEKVEIRADCVEEPGATGAGPSEVVPTTGGQAPVPPGFDPASVVPRRATETASPGR